MNVVEEVYAQHACTVVSYTKSMVVVGDVEGRFPRVREVWPGDLRAAIEEGMVS